MKFVKCTVNRGRVQTKYEYDSVCYDNLVEVWRTWKSPNRASDTVAVYTNRCGDYTYNSDGKLIEVLKLFVP